MLGELTSRIRLHARPATTIEGALRGARLVRKQLEVPLVTKEGGPLLIGRDEQFVALVINHPYISRKHAVIVKEDDAFYVRDLCSKNGTYLNDERIASGERSKDPLRHGDRIRFNHVEFEFVVPS